MVDCAAVELALAVDGDAVGVTGNYVVVYSEHVDMTHSQNLPCPNPPKNIPFPFMLDSLTITFVFNNPQKRIDETARREIVTVVDQAL